MLLQHSGGFQAILLGQRACGAWGQRIWRDLSHMFFFVERSLSVLTSSQLQVLLQLRRVDISWTGEC
eukprot:s1381_g3.t1